MWKVAGSKEDDQIMKKIIFLVIANLLLLVAISQGETVRIAYLQSDIHQLPCWVALEKKFFEKEGVKVDVVGTFKAGPELMSAFAAGALDMDMLALRQQPQQWPIRRPKLLS